MIAVVPYKPYNAPQLRQWLDARGMTATSLDDLPEVGFIAISAEGAEIGAGFLRKIEGGYAMIDSLVTNPSASPEDRHAAMDKIMQKLIDTARKRNIRYLLGSTVDENTRLRAERLGFTTCPHALMSLTLKDINKL